MVVKDSVIFVIKGCSGSGKSSRVFQLLAFFRDLGETILPLSFTINYRRQKVGLILKDQGLALFGKLYKSGKVERWQGLDAVTGQFKGSSNISSILSEAVNDYNVIIEGASVFDSYRFRPKYLYEECGFDNIFMQYYNYTKTQRDDYIARIVGRTGVPPRKDVMWTKNIAFVRECEKSITDEKEMKNIANRIKVNVGAFDEPIEDFGIFYLTATNQKQYIKKFLRFVKKFDYINRNTYDSRDDKIVKPFF